MLERPQGVYTLEHPQPLPPHLAPGSNSLTCLPLLLPVPPKWLSLSLLPRSLLALPFPILPLLLPFRSDTSPPRPPAPPALKPDLPPPACPALALLSEEERTNKTRLNSLAAQEPPALGH